MYQLRIVKPGIFILFLSSIFARQRKGTCHSSSNTDIPQKTVTSMWNDSVTSMVQGTVVQSINYSVFCTAAAANNREILEERTETRCSTRQ